MKAFPITHKATRSPLKLSAEALVANDQQAYKQFNDVAKDYASGRKEGISMTQKKTPQRSAPKDITPPKEKPVNAQDQVKVSGPETHDTSKIPSLLKV